VQSRYGGSSQTTTGSISQISENWPRSSSAIVGISGHKKSFV
jgi:hypothetical protein